MKALCCCSFVCWTALFLAAQARSPAVVEVTADPAHHVVLENSYVRVSQVYVAPHSATSLHHHPYDYMFVTLGPSEISNEVEGKAPLKIKLAEGETRFTSGGFVHVTRNLAETPFRNITVEFLRRPKASNPRASDEDERGLQVLHGGTEEVIFYKDGVRVSEVDLQIAGVEPRHHHTGPQLLVAVTDLVLRSEVSGKGASTLEMKSGDVKWLPSGLTHTVTNVGTQKATFVIAEFQ